MMASELGKTVVASINVEDINPQTMKPAVTKGKKFDNGDLNRPPKINPMQHIVTAVEIVIQKGPRLDRLYLCLISALAR